MHFERLTTALLNDEESAGGNHVLACNFAKIFTDLKETLTDSTINLS